MYLCHPCGNMQETLTKWCTQCGTLLDLDNSLARNVDIHIKLDHITKNYLSEMSNKDIFWNQQQMDKVKNTVLELFKEMDIDSGLR